MNSLQHKRRFFGAIIKDLYDSLDEIYIPDYKWKNGRPIIIRYNQHFTDADTMRWYLKIFDENYPKSEAGEPYSTKDVTDKQLALHTEYLTYVAGMNGLTFKVDNEEWERTIERYNR